jgi:hypothetical protein
LLLASIASAEMLTNRPRPGPAAGRHHNVRARGNAVGRLETLRGAIMRGEQRVALRDHFFERHWREGSIKDLRAWPNRILKTRQLLRTALTCASDAEMAAAITHLGRRIATAQEGGRKRRILTSSSKGLRRTVLRAVGGSRVRSCARSGHGDAEEAV